MDTAGLQRPPIPHVFPTVPHDIWGVGNVALLLFCPPGTPFGHNFVARIDAEGWLVDQERMISRGQWEPPDRQVREDEAAPLLLGEYAGTVVARRRIRPGTAALYAKLLRLTILPAFAKRPLGEITAAEVSTWYAEMRSTPTQQANAYSR